MPDRNRSSSGERIAVLVRTLLVKRSVQRPVGRDENLAECGLTSLDLVNLMLAVEGEFGLKIPDPDMTPANFRTVARIEALVGALLEHA